MEEFLLLLGGNVGDVRATQERAQALLAERIGRIVSRSREHWTEPWGFADERLFLNRALLIETSLAPLAVMENCLLIERELGRERGRSKGYAARTIDIDVLFIGDRMIGSETLVVPHPRVHERAFALSPVADIAPDLVHPLLHRSILELLNDVLQAA